MGWLLEQAPRSIEEMWTTWMQVREQHVKCVQPPVTKAASNPILLHKNGDDDDDDENQKMEDDANDADLSYFNAETIANQMMASLQEKESARLTRQETYVEANAMQTSVKDVVTLHDTRAEMMNAPVGLAEEEAESAVHLSVHRSNQYPEFNDENLAKLTALDLDLDLRTEDASTKLHTHILS
jgi:hypothetical protein